MGRIILEYKDKEEKAFLLALLKRLGIESHQVEKESSEEETLVSIPDKKRSSTNQFEKLNAVLDQYAANNLFKDIDPVEWQKSIRDEWG